NVLTLVQRPVVLASAVILAFNIHAVRSPGRRTIHFGLFNVMHTYRDTQHGGESDKVCANVADGQNPMVSAPVRHYRVHIRKRPFTGEARCKPGGWPG